MLSVFYSPYMKFKIELISPGSLIRYGDVNQHYETKQKTTFSHRLIINGYTLKYNCYHILVVRLLIWIFLKEF